MKKSFLTLCGLLLTSALYAQSSVPAATQKKMDVLWKRAEYRMVVIGDHYWHDGFHYHLMRMLFVLAEVNPKNVETFSNLGYILDSYGQSKRAFQVYDRGIAENPNEFDLYLDAGFWQFQKGNYAQATRYLEKAITFKNAPVIVFKTLAHTYERMGETDKSIKMWEQTVRRFPNDAASKVNLERVRRKAQGGTGT